MRTDTARARMVTWTWLGALSLTSLALGAAGFWRMFAHFPGYDDEGYILISAREYLQRGDLYGTVYSQYGPAFYVLIEALHRVTGAAIDHGFARWFTLALWLGCAATAGALAGRVARSRLAGWFAGVAVFLFHFQLSEEAFHPGAVVIFILPVALWAMAELIERDRLAPAAAVAGATTAGLALLKINVGVLFAAGCAVWFLFVAGGGKKGRIAGVVLAIAFGAALLQGLRGEQWVQVFLLLFAVGAGGLGAASRAQVRAGLLPAWTFLAGGSGLAVLVILAVMHRGTSVPALWQGIVRGPLGHAHAYSFAIDWRPGTVGSCLVSLLALAFYLRARRQDRTEAALAAVAGLRLLQLVGVLLVLALLGHARVIGALFSYSIPWLWLWVVPFSTEAAETKRSAGRELVAVGTLLQTLHAYPVGGIQLCWGSFLVFVLVGIALPETLGWLRRRAGGRAGTLLAALVPVVMAAKVGATAWEYRDVYRERTALALPGTAGLRLSAREVAAYQSVVTNAALHADRLFSLPGMFSFNLWSGVPSPTTRNTTLWYSLLSEKEQADIVAALEQSARPALVVDGALVSILHASGAAPAGPLYAHLLAAYRPAFSLQGLSFWVRQGRTIAPVGTAWAQPGPRGAPVRLYLIGTGEPVAALELTAPDAPRRAPVRLDAHNARVTIEFVRPDGTARFSAQELSWPFRFTGLACLTVESPDFERLGDQAQLLTLRTTDGKSAGVAVLVDP